MQLLVSGLFSTADSYGRSNAMIEIILMLLVAFILGYLLRYFIQKSGTDNNRDYNELSHKYALLENQLSVNKNELNKLQNDLNDCQKNKDNALLALQSQKKKPVQKDDLKIVEGIGPKIEQLLYEAEIYSWDDLSKAEIKTIQMVLDQAGPNYKVHNPESWPFQAKLALEEKWDELKKWQDEHKGGRF